MELRIYKKFIMRPIKLFLAVAPIRAAAFLCPRRCHLKYRIDRTELPYDAMVPDPSFLLTYEEEGDEYDEKTEEVQADEVHGEGQPV